MNHIMLDLETLDDRPTSVIVAIGAVRFSLDDEDDYAGLSDEFYAVISAKSCQEYGLTIGAETVAWWAQQADEARRILYHPDTDHLPQSLIAFNNFIRDKPEESAVWGNGSTFDNVILRNAYRACGIIPAWKYNRDFCFRTMKNMFPTTEPERQGIHHNALDDAKHQARWLIKIMENIRR